jgi:hypothetical protein
MSVMRHGQMDGELPRGDGKEHEHAQEKRFHYIDMWGHVEEDTSRRTGKQQHDANDARIRSVAQAQPGEEEERLCVPAKVHAARHSAYARLSG